MTDETVISRTQFIECYQDQLNQLFLFNEDGGCVIKVHANSDVLVFHNMTLAGWSADTETFQNFVDFISVVTKPTKFILAEVESIEKFTEVRVVSADRHAVENLWVRSHLPHFNIVCFDESAKWCAYFDNIEDKVSVCRTTNNRKE